MEFHLYTKYLAISNILPAVILICFQAFFGYKGLSITLCAFVLIFSSLLRLMLLKIFNPLTFKYFKYTNLSNYVFKMLSKSLPFGLAAAAYLLYMRIDIIMIEHFLSPKEVGIYSLAVQMMTICTIAIVPIQTVIFPSMREKYEHSMKSFYETYIFITTVSWVIFILVSLLIFTVFSYLIENYNRDYTESINVYIILTISGFLVSLSILRSLHFVLNDSGKFLLFIQVVALIINVFLNYILIPIYGINGGAIATVISQFISLFLSNFASSKHSIVSILQIKSLNICSLKKYHKVLK